ncbi:PepSY domain-containing protein [Paracoccus sp. (in: a-proteobacteria)]|uniref:PepSY domain-containing protein n=1 Tax=Paracoccus sp. TaxID=267 RepID=UPI003A89469B
MRHPALILTVLTLLAALHTAAEEFRPLPYHELAERVEERFAGRLIGARTDRPKPEEAGLGAALVYEFRLVTPQRNLLRIRLDARTGRFLEVAGRGLVAAWRKNDDED